jgi:hypothetical protein
MARISLLSKRRAEKRSAFRHSESSGILPARWIIAAIGFLTDARTLLVTQIETNCGERSIWQRRY